MESEGPLGSFLDASDETDKFGGENWEDSESRMLKQTVETVLKKAGVKGNEVEYIISGDLLGQMIASSFGIKALEIPMLGGKMAGSSSYCTFCKPPINQNCCQKQGFSHCGAGSVHTKHRNFMILQSSIWTVDLQFMTTKNRMYTAEAAAAAVLRSH